MFDSKMMVETTEEQPAAEAAIMASAMAGRADAFGGGAISSSDEMMLPAKTVSRQFHSASKVDVCAKLDTAVWNDAHCHDCSDHGNGTACFEIFLCCFHLHR